MTTIELSTPKVDRKLFAQAFGGNQTAIRYLESMVRDITVTLPDAITNNGQTFQQNSQTGTTLATGVTANAVSINLEAGSWDISGVIVFNSAANTVIEQITAGVSSVSMALATPDTYQQLPFTLSGAAAFNLAVPLTRVKLANPGPVFLVAQGIFNTSTLSVDGYISARPGNG